MSVLVVIIGLMLTLVLPRVLPKGTGLAAQPAPAKIPAATEIPAPAETPAPTPLPPQDIPTPTPTPAPIVYQLTLGTGGSLTEDARVVSGDGRAVLSLAKGTKLTDAQGQPLASIRLTAKRLPLRPDVGVVGLYEFQPNGATLDPPATLTIGYDPKAYYPFQYLAESQNLPSAPTWQNNGRVYMAFMDDTGALLPYLTSVRSSAGSVTVSLDHLGTIVLYIV